MSDPETPRPDAPGPDLSKMDAQARRFLAMVLLGASDAAQVSADERRRSFDKLMRLSKPPAAGVDTTDRMIKGCGTDIPVRLYTPAPSRKTLPGLVYFHGGGLVAGSIDTHDALCKSLAVGADCRVLSIDYRLAPEHPFPAAVVDALVTTRSIIRNADAFGLDPKRIGVGGDSGGATLAAIVAQALRRRVKAQILLCPVLDFIGPHPSKRAFGKGFLLDDATMARDLADYAPRRSLDDPHVSPLHGKDFVGLPRTLVYIAGFDPLRDEGAAYAARLGEAGVDVTLRCYGSLIHHFYGLTAMIPAAGVALSAIAKDVGRALA